MDLLNFTFELFDRYKPLPWFHCTNKMASCSHKLTTQKMAMFTLPSSLLLLFLCAVIIPTTLADKSNPATFLSLCGRNQSRNMGALDTNFESGNINFSGFGTSVAGASPNTVYMLGQCFDYLSSINCQLCSAKSRVRLPLCLPATEGRIYLDGCFLRYADRNISQSSVDKSDTSVCANTSAITSNQTLFNNTVNGLVSNLTVGAGGDKGYYKSGSAAASPGVTVYGVAQCWRSLNVSGCIDCLKSAGERVAGCLPASDGKALNAGCFLRYSLDPFYLDTSTQSGGSSVSQRRLGAVLGSVFGALIVIAIVIAIAIFRMRRRRATNVSTNVQNGSGEFLRSIAASNLSFKYEDLSSATDNFNEINKLGQGGYGSVYKGVLPDGRVIAVKRLFFNTRQRADQFFNEVTLVNQVQHKNLVKLLGCSIEGPEDLLVYEYLCNTSLDKFLYDSLKKTPLDWVRRNGIIVGTAEGLAYLHSSSEVRIIHRDIKAGNILLDERFRPKIADFGLARFFAEGQSHLSTGLAGTFGYMAPEYIVHGQLSEKADTYSYGVLVIEIITGRKNRNSISSEGHSLMSMVWQHFLSKTLIEVLDPHLQGQCSKEEALQIFHVGLLCTQSSPILRPPMWKVVEMLTNRSKDLPLPTPPPFTESSRLLSSSSKSHISENQMSISTFQGR